MPYTRKTPHLVERDGSLRCSLCDMPLGTSKDKTLSKIFTEHIRTNHRTGRTKEDFSQAAARIVREATEDR
jgi:hypothetical protein